MGLREKIKKASEESAKIAGIASLPFFAHAAYQYYGLLSHQKKINSFEEGALFAISAIAGIGVFIGGTGALKMLSRFAYEPEIIQKIEECKTRTKRKLPHIPLAEEINVSFNIKDYLYSSLAGTNGAVADRNRYAAYGRKNKKPAFLHEAAKGYMHAKEYDEGLLCIRDTLDLLNGKRPKLNSTYLPDFSVEQLANYLERFRRPDAIEVYLLSAVQEVFSNPEKASYWSILAKEIAKELNHELKNEAQIFDALLATVQKRSDKEQAWKEAFETIQQNFEPERLGESRNLVWTLKSTKKFFSGTFAFKGNTDKKELQNEWNSTLKLEQILDENATAPQPIQITEKQENSLYVYVMRYLSGEMLLNQILKGNKNGIQKTIPVLARIHARYPTEGLARLNLEEKTARKLKSLGMPSLIKYNKPIITDLQTQPAWRVNKDAHPGQWLILNNPAVQAKVGVLDCEIKETQPIVLDIANLLYFAGEFTKQEREKYITTAIKQLNKEGASIRDAELANAYENTPRQLFRAVDNAAIHRMICLIEATDQPGRDHSQKERFAKTAITAIDDLKEHDPAFYKQNQNDYDTLKTRLPEFLSTT